MIFLSWGYFLIAIWLYGRFFNHGAGLHVYVSYIFITYTCMLQAVEVPLWCVDKKN